MGIRHPRQRGPGDCKWCRPRHGRPGLIKRAKWIPPSPRSYSEWWQIQVGGKREAEGSAVWVPSLISCPRGFSPLQFSCQGPHLSLFANRVFLTCHLLPLCPSADKGPGEITESISAASVRQRLLNTSGGAPSHPDTRGVRRPGSGAGPKEAPAGPPEEFAVPPARLRSLHGCSLPLLGEDPDELPSESEDQMLSSSPFSFFSKSHKDLGRKYFLGNVCRSSREDTGNGWQARWRKEGKKDPPGTVLVFEPGAEGIEPRQP